MKVLVTTRSLDRVDLECIDYVDADEDVVGAKHFPGIALNFVKITCVKLIVL